MADVNDPPKYVNVVMVRHSPNEFWIDLINLFEHLNGVPADKKPARLEGRYVLTPSHAKELAAVLASNVQRYEEKFGEIVQAKEKQPEETPKTFTFN